jgi:hypothetical protein
LVTNAVIGASIAKKWRKIEGVGGKGGVDSECGIPKSKWANPFHIGRDGTRDEVIAKYLE